MADEQRRLVQMGLRLSLPQRQELESRLPVVTRPRSGDLRPALPSQFQLQLFRFREEQRRAVLPQEGRRFVHRSQLDCHQHQLRIHSCAHIQRRVAETGSNHHRHCRHRRDET